GTRSAHATRLVQLYEQWQSNNSQFVLRSVADGFIENVARADDSTPTTREDRNERRSYKKGRRELEHEFGKQMRFKPIRTLLSSDCRPVITDLKPIWLMSPLSVSDTLPLVDDVDVVIFDEASQVTLEDAVPSLCRGKQVIVVGDQMQLPPTNFFSTRSSGEEGGDEFTYSDDEGDEISYDLASASFLEFADRNLASTMLGWHYRSRSESLISFSNWRFYDGRLLTVPEEHFGVGRDECEKIASIEAAARAADLLYDRPISFHLLDHGCYENRRNRNEADHIACLVRDLLCNTQRNNLADRQLPEHATVGVIAFSQAQQAEIESALSRLAEEDMDFASRLDEESVREEDGQFVGLLVKNLENIQGDERDVILLSVCYGPDPTGRIRMNFGPINKDGGEKRLNVAFSRAKHHMAIVTSMRHSSITNDYNPGAAALRDYLNYAESHSEGRHGEAAMLLKRLVHQRRGEVESRVQPSVLKQQVIEALERQGWQIDQDVGQSHFRIDLAIKQPGDSKYRLGVLLDDATYRTADVFERDVQRPHLLQAFGWNITHILAKDWYEDPDGEVQRIVGLL
ncbi:MAG: AAA domain-containing protein, partial [Pirellulaceae bacterium]